MIGVFMPLLLFWFIPIIWTVDDLQIRGIDEKKTTDCLEDSVRDGFLGKFFGMAGILLAFDFIQTLLYSDPDFAADGQFLITIEAVFILLFLILFMMGPAYIFGMFYLQGTHEAFINKMRIKISKMLPVGITSVRNATAEEMNHFIVITKEIKPKPPGLHLNKKPLPPSQPLGAFPANSNPGMNWTPIEQQPRFQPSGSFTPNNQNSNYTVPAPEPRTYFCVKCGKKFILQPGIKFCESCGADIEAQGI